MREKSFEPKRFGVLPVSESLLQVLRDRAESRCEYCRLPASPGKVKFETEHIVPRSHGGSNSRSNLAFSCYHCNRHKGTNLTGFDPRAFSRKPVSLFHPRVHRWDDHFEMMGAKIVGRTSIGRTTVNVLKMNSELMFMLREFLLSEEHDLGN